MSAVNHGANVMVNARFMFSYVNLVECNLMYTNVSISKCIKNTNKAALLTKGENMQVYVEICTFIECILNVDIIECKVMQTYATTTECVMHVTISVCIKTVSYTHLRAHETDS